jgi:hypothetical protein
VPSRTHEVLRTRRAAAISFPDTLWQGGIQRLLRYGEKEERDSDQHKFPHPQDNLDCHSTLWRRRWLVGRGEESLAHRMGELVETQQILNISQPPWNIQNAFADQNTNNRNLGDLPAPSTAA